MKRSTRAFYVLLAVLILLSCGSALANSAEPPALVLLVSGAPEDFSLSARMGDTQLTLSPQKTAWETYYVLYYHSMPPSKSHSIEEAITLDIHANGGAFTLHIAPEEIQLYNTTFTVNLKNKTLEPGISRVRTAMLVVLRVVLTLLIEGLCFYLFGFREKRSWIAFLLINLVTQGLLNISLTGSGPLAPYLLLGLIIAEALVLIAEFIAFLFAVKEHKRLRRMLYVLTANVLSLVLGGLLITYLPV